MDAKLHANEWAKGAFFLLAALTTGWYGSGYMDGLSPVAKALFLAQPYLLLAALAPSQWRSRPYRMAALGLGIAAAPFLAPDAWLPQAPPVVMLVTEGEGWARVLFILGGASVAVGSLTYAASLLAAPRTAAKASPRPDGGWLRPEQGRTLAAASTTRLYGLTAYAAEGVLCRSILPLHSPLLIRR